MSSAVALPSVPVPAPDRSPQPASKPVIPASMQPALFVGSE
jgi:hypothetical protein